MSIFSSILSKLGFGEAKAAPVEVAPTEAEAAVAEASNEQVAASLQPQAIEVIDVMAQLETLAAERGGQSNWKVSIADLMRLLDLDYSYAARKELAEELGCPAENMGDSALMNMWLHKTVLQKLAENGGNIPSDLL